MPLQDRPVLRAYAEFEDLPENRLVQAYSLAEIASEKLIALADPARNEPRDLYDLWYLTSSEGLEMAPLESAIRRKLAFRNRPAGALKESILREEARLKALSSARLAGQMVRLPPFEEVFRETRRALRQAGLP